MKVSCDLQQYLVSPPTTPLQMDMVGHLSLSFDSDSGEALALPRVIVYPLRLVVITVNH